MRPPAAVDVGARLVGSLLTGRMHETLGATWNYQALEPALQRKNPMVAAGRRARRADLRRPAARGPHPRRALPRPGHPRAAARVRPRRTVGRGEPGRRGARRLAQPRPAPRPAWCANRSTRRSPAAPRASPLGPRCPKPTGASSASGWPTTSCSAPHRKSTAAPPRACAPSPTSSCPAKESNPGCPPASEASPRGDLAPGAAAVKCGSSSAMRAPPSGDWQARDQPPWASAMARTMASPSPEPPETRARSGSVRYSLSNTRSRCCRWDPRPVVADRERDTPAGELLHLEADESGPVRPCAPRRCGRDS